MLHIAYYEAEVKDFCTADPNAVLGELTNRHGFALESQQKFAWALCQCAHAKPLLLHC